MIADEYKKDGYVRRVFDDCVCFTPTLAYRGLDVVQWDYDVVRLAFVPDYHVARWEDEHNEEGNPFMTLLSTHKTLAEAISICKVLLANGGIKYERA
jgi:hypothetical protein